MAPQAKKIRVRCKNLAFHTTESLNERGAKMKMAPQAKDFIVRSVTQGPPVVQLRFYQELFLTLTTITTRQARGDVFFSNFYFTVFRVCYLGQIHFYFNFTK